MVQRRDRQNLPVWQFIGDDSSRMLRVGSTALFAAYC